jgi:hypothetical protein
MRAVFDTVEELTGFTQDDLASNRRGKRISTVRQITAYILYNSYDHKIDELCIALNRQRNTVYYMIAQVENYDECTPECDLYVEILDACPEKSERSDQNCHDLLDEAVAIMCEFRSKRLFTREARDIKAKMEKWIKKVRIQ